MAITLANKSHSTTKRGPGRVHLQGYKRAKKVAPKGAGIGFVQHYNAAKRAARTVERDLGQRPDLSAQRAQDAKADRSRKARAKRAMGL